MQNLVNYFTGVIKNKKLSHLYLISGQLGNYKLDEVLLVCRLILSEYSDNPNLLEQIKNFNHPNIIFVSKEEGSNTIKKEDIIKLQNEFSKTALIKGPRIFIINEIEAMSGVAANSLLKFLEEPQSENTIGFLLTDNIDQVLSTIKSRSQIIKLDSITEDKIVNKIIENNPDFNYDEVVLGVMIYNDELLTEENIINENLANTLKMILDFINIVNKTSSSGIYIPVFQNNIFNFSNIEEYRNFLIVILKYFLDVQRLNSEINIHYKIWELQAKQSVFVLNNEKTIKIIDLLQEYLQLSVTSVNLELLKDNFLIEIERIVVGT